MELKGVGGREGRQNGKRHPQAKTRSLEISATKEQIVTLPSLSSSFFLLGLKLSFLLCFLFVNFVIVSFVACVLLTTCM